MDIFKFVNSTAGEGFSLYLSTSTFITFSLEQEVSCSFLEDGNKDFTYTPYILLSGLYVASDLRCKGYGRQLLREGITEAKKRWPGLPIRLSAHPEEDVISQEDLIAFYESEGFYVERTENVVVMRHD